MIYHFGVCTFDPARGELCRAGEVIVVEPQALRVLHYLLEHRERVVSREELFEQCWPESYVSDSALTSCLSRVRRAIGQPSSGATLIQTLHRRGYRFVGEVSELTEPSVPDAPPPALPQPPALMPEPDEPLILVVDDEPTNVELLERQLHRQGYATRRAYNGQEALDQVAVEAPNLILLDVMMPVLDGLAVCRELKGEVATRPIPIILLTAFDSHEDRRRGLEAGADGLLTKPVERRELLAQIEAVLSPSVGEADSADATRLEPTASVSSLGNTTPAAALSAFEAPVPSSDPSPSPSRVLPEADVLPERRHLTVLRCMIGDAEALALQLDPEDHYELMQAFRSRCMELVSQYEGQVVQQLDDGMLVYFGYPQAHEDDAQRAVRSGLAVVESLGQLVPTGLAVGQSGLKVRVGIDTGMVIVALPPSGSATPSLAVGSAATRAAELSALAAPGAVVISESTARLTQGYFDGKALSFPSPTVPGESVVGYEVRGVSGLQTRLEVGAAHGLTPFVGREAEVALLRDRWTYVQEGLGQVMLVQGEAGMGKSRLIQMWREQLSDDPPMALECRCSPYHQNTPFYPVIDLMQRAMRGTSAAPAGLDRLEDWLSPYDIDLSEAIPLLAELLSLPLPVGRYAPLTLTPQRQRERTVTTLLSLLLAQAAQAPLLFIVEDIHWADPSTLDFLQEVMDHGSAVSLLMVLTCRPNFESNWPQWRELTPVMLNRLTRPQMAHMITQVASGKALPEAVMQQLIEKTDGVPLFTEEMTRMVLESGQLVEREGAYELSGELAELTIPATLQDSLVARLDRLGSAKEIAQWGSVLGREFSYGVLAAVTPYEPEALQEGLPQLVAVGLVSQRGFFPQTHYRFKHALIQDAAYESMPKRRRQAIHERIAQVLEAQFSDIVEAQPELMAHHYTEAGLTEQAIPYWQQAGRRAIERSAHVEAIAHLRQGLAVLTTLPETPERLHQELDLQVALGSVLSATKGQGSSDMAGAYARARDLCQQLGDTPQLFPVLRGLILYNVSRGDLQTGYPLGEQLLRLAHSQSDPARLLLAHYMIGILLFFRGEPTAAHTHLRQALTIYTPQVHRTLAVRYGIDFGVASGGLLAWELWQLGYPDQALQHSQASRGLAQEVSHPESLAFALFYAAMLHQSRREALAAHEQSASAMTLATEQGFAPWVARSMVFHGWALAQQGQVEAGIAEMRQGLAANLAAGLQLLQPYFLGLLAEAYGKGGQPEAGLNELSEAQAAMDATDARFYAAELSRLKGELLLRQRVPDAAQAEPCFHQALETARQQQAKSWELRAAMSLARLWQQQGKRREAHELLASIYEWFTEGFDTADLKDAAALLEELRA